MKHKNKGAFLSGINRLRRNTLKKAAFIGAIEEGAILRERNHKINGHFRVDANRIRNHDE
ncbi:hypothetical protein ACEUAI_20405 [Aeromonas veronii]